MTDKERLARAFQEYLSERRILKSASLATGQHVIIMALIRIVNLLERQRSQAR